MAILNFPNNPFSGQQYEAPNGALYTWDSLKGVWTSFFNVGPPALTPTIDTPSIISPGDNETGVNPSNVTLVSNAYSGSNSPGAHGSSDWQISLDSSSTLTSTNVITGKTQSPGLWVEKVSSFGCTDITGIAYGNGVYVAVGRANKIATSGDGSSWTQRANPFSAPGDGTLFGVTFGNNIFVAHGLRGQLGTSPDGVAWTMVEEFASTEIFGSVYGNSLFVVVGSNGAIYTSPDGSTWQSRTSGTGEDLLGVAYGDDSYVAVGSLGTILTSSDGVTWTSSTSGTSARINDVTFADGVFVAVADEGVLLTSPDGVTWTLRDGGFESSIIWAVSYGLGFFIAAGDSGKLAVSSDGISWTQQTPMAIFGSSPIYCISYANSLYIVGGVNGKIATSSSPSDSLILSIVGCQLDGFTLGDKVSNSLSEPLEATGVITAISDTDVTLSAVNGDWGIGQNLYKGQYEVNVLGSTSLTSFPVPIVLSPQTTYYARVRYNSVDNPPIYTSNWSVWSSFTTGSGPEPEPEP